jgi:hypothetical protein
MRENLQAGERAVSIRRGHECVGVPEHVLESSVILADTATEVLVELKPPPQRLFADSAPTNRRANYLRFRLSPSSANEGCSPSSLYAFPHHSGGLVRYCPIARAT